MSISSAQSLSVNCKTIRLLIYAFKGKIMALIQCVFFSDVLGMSHSMNVILPQKAKGIVGMKSRASEGKHPTILLLHGLTDDHTVWCRRTSIERYVSDMGLAVIMPAVHRSFYTDIQNAGQYWTFISEELPVIARRFFPLSARRENNFVAGLSMGGYGAFKPPQSNRFCKFCCLGSNQVARCQMRSVRKKRLFFPLKFGILTDSQICLMLSLFKPSRNCF